MQDDQIPSWEKTPGEKIDGTADQESLDRADAFEEAMDDAPVFTGEAGEEYDENISDAAAVAGYLNAVASEKGVGYVMDAVYKFDALGSDDPVRDLYESMGIDTPDEVNEIIEEKSGTKNQEIGYNATSPNANRPAKKLSKEGFIQGIQDMKDLINVVKTDPKFEELRAGASAMGLGIPEYAVRGCEKQDFVSLMRVLAEQREKLEAEENLQNPEKAAAKKQEELDKMKAEFFSKETSAGPDSANAQSGEMLGNLADDDKKAVVEAWEEEQKNINNQFK